MEILHCFGEKDIRKVNFELPPLGHNQIKVQTIYCGICRSDIANYGGFEAMPYGGEIGHWGHEGLGRVVDKSQFCDDVEIGDIVSTISDPAYAPFYYAKKGEYVKVPEASYKYILQPVACAVNILNQLLKYYSLTLREFVYNPYGKFNDFLLIGTGFMSLVILQMFDKNRVGHNIDVIGNSNLEHVKSYRNVNYLGKEITYDKQYDAIIDLSSKESVFYELSKLIKVEGLIVYSATPFTPVTTNFFDLCWNCNTLIMPSPRNKDFHNSMVETVNFIQDGIIETGRLWTCGYEFDNYIQGFEDGLNRTPNYIRGFLKYE